jgi:hypothetical protein
MFNMIKPVVMLIFPDALQQRCCQRYMLDVSLYIQGVNGASSVMESLLLWTTICRRYISTFNRANQQQTCSMKS